MTALRKKWRLVVFPGARRITARSETDAYRMVRAYLADRNLGVTRVHAVDVYVDDRTGAGWALFEKIDLDADGGAR